MKSSRARQILVTGAVIAATAALIATGTAAVAAPAESATIDLGAAGYTPGQGAPAGQNGWSNPTADFDFALVENADFPDSGLAAGRSLRISNGQAPASHRYLTSPAISAAGESTTGATFNVFETEFTVTSATGDLQLGLTADVALDGASRYGGVVNLRHTADGLAVGSYWLPWEATSTTNSQWRSATFATVPADVSHRIRVVAYFLDGQPDVLQVFVDGTLVSDGSGATTWETYDDLAGSSDRTVDQVTFKTSPSAPTADGIGYTSAPAVPSTTGNGFLFSDIAYSVRVGAPPAPTAPPTLPTAPSTTPDVDLELDRGVARHGEAVEIFGEGFLPYENTYLTIFSTPVFGGWFQADALGRVRGTLALPTSLAAGTHTFQLTGPFSGNVALAQLEVLALAETGPADVAPTAMAGFAALALGATGLVIARLSRVRDARHRVR